MVTLENEFQQNKFYVNFVSHSTYSQSSPRNNFEKKNAACTSSLHATVGTKTIRFATKSSSFNQEYMLLAAV
jgi:hypothetical protein